MSSQQLLQKTDIKLSVKQTFGFESDSLDVYSILYEYGLSPEFEEEVEKEAKRIDKKIL